MKKAVLVTAALLIGASPAFAQKSKGASEFSPGDQMRDSRTQTTKGASEYAPGDRMKEPGTTGMSKGASELSPGDKMNDRRKK
ncbi:MULTISPECIES: hypothetical protein [Bradyrhizobium]|jgi:hypothetical protein|uniref:Pentapeptide MXKDX repeat protein n=2 Tax=Bradyrhizobium TaxID=374 RepID=A0ABY0QB64_9BRAD|nr:MULTISPECIES: hypothetical protein [Bradyrhizobium]SDJ83064.1 hypothetical protein SAMN05444163_6543 [Bradyrhizobium ottawaense]SEC08214.1 hypothetical protein SAMN05444171_0615 [Bradyrhizobium lablabi]